jgi:hypothetical protein
MDWALKLQVCGKTVGVSVFFDLGYAVKKYFFHH